jgi:predicted Zn finger-like uncharacterized protein
VQIACPNCATTYVLDERLLPPSGAPVQCTRCAHVFSAKPAKSAPQGNQTQIFGVNGPGEAPLAKPPRSATQVFGVVAPTKPVAAPAPPPSGAAGMRGTQVFGAIPRMPEGASPNSTQRFGELLDGKTQPHTVPPLATAPVSRGTQVFGQVLPPVAQLLSSARRADPSVPVPIPDVTPVPPPPASGNGSATMRGTQIFGGPVVSHASKVTPVAAEQADPNALLTPAAGVPAAFDPYSDDAPVDDDGTESTDPSAANRDTLPRAPVELPAELPSAARAPEVDPAAELRASLTRRNRTVVAALAVLVVGAGGYLGARQWLARHPKIPIEANLALGHGGALMNKDDASSLRDAAALFKQLCQSYPAFAEARADLLIADVLQLDDAQMEVTRISGRSNELNAQIEQLKNKRSTSDWENRVNAMREELVGLSRTVEPLNERMKVLTSEVNGAVQRLRIPGEEPSRDEERALSRANAIYLGVTGRAEVQQAADRYRELGGMDGWDRIAMAEYAANAHVPDAVRSAAVRGVAELRTREPTVIRSYVLEARLALVERRKDAAVSALDAALALNPSHELARTLLSEAQH